MPSDNRKRWLHQEEARLEKYQHQHRGLNFKRLLLPPVTDRKVNLVGRDNHIYRGSVPRVPLDELPPEVDESSIDEEALYKEIRDMNFPPVPKQEPLGPSRRIEGKYTLAKRLALAPVHLDCTEGLEETLVLGKDDGVYRSKEKYPSRIELDKKLRGTKRQIQKVVRTSSSRGFVEPSLVLLHTSDKPPLSGKHKKSLIQLPTAEVRNIIAMVRSESIKEKHEQVTDTSDQSEATELKQEDFQIKADKIFEKSEETETGDETDIEQRETDTDEGSLDLETSLSIEKTDKDSDTESIERGSEEPVETQEVLNTEEIKETAEKSDTESIDTGSEEPVEAEEPLGTEEIKETVEELDTESIETASEEPLDTGEMEETEEETDSD